jgi:hypothetical protein
VWRKRKGKGIKVHVLFVFSLLFVVWEEREMWRRGG